MNPNPEIVSFTINYADGTTEEVLQGLLAFMPDADNVIVKAGGLDFPLLLMLLAGLERTAEAYLAEN